eukprot:TRINITY_DN11379_c0_g4_i1.p1 TRINITY_DN11379_c0_g4~~TRINITY_DN11379_c0_g4_i1.p1  ORF type:complete len:487 (+),score=128.55 TRINITY_DN11379_c0_g4_i1:77-1537(+)
MPVPVLWLLVVAGAGPDRPVAAVVREGSGCVPTLRRAVRGAVGVAGNATLPARAGLAIVVHPHAALSPAARIYTSTRTHPLPDGAHRVAAPTGRDHVRPATRGADRRPATRADRRPDAALTAEDESGSGASGSSSGGGSDAGSEARLPAPSYSVGDGDPPLPDVGADAPQPLPDGGAPQPLPDGGAPLRLPDGGAPLRDVGADAPPPDGSADAPLADGSADAPLRDGGVLRRDGSYASANAGGAGSTDGSGSGGTEEALLPRDGADGISGDASEDAADEARGVRQRADGGEVLNPRSFTDRSNASNAGYSDAKGGVSDGSSAGSGSDSTAGSGSDDSFLSVHDLPLRLRDADSNGSLELPPLPPQLLADEWVAAAGKEEEEPGTARSRVAAAPGEANVAVFVWLGGGLMALAVCMPAGQDVAQLLLRRAPSFQTAVIWLILWQHRRRHPEEPGLAAAPPPPHQPPQPQPREVFVPALSGWLLHMLS